MCWSTASGPVPASGSESGPTSAPRSIRGRQVRDRRRHRAAVLRPPLGGPRPPGRPAAQPVGPGGVSRHAQDLRGAVCEQDPRRVDRDIRRHRRLRNTPSSSGRRRDGTSTCGRGRRWCGPTVSTRPLRRHGSPAPPPVRSARPLRPQHPSPTSTGS